MLVGCLVCVSLWVFVLLFLFLVFKECEISHVQQGISSHATAADPMRSRQTRCRVVEGPGWGPLLLTSL